MPTQVRSVVVLALTGVLAGCVAPRPPVKSYDPFAGARDRVRPAVRVVALGALHGPSELQQTDAMKVRFIATVEARLREAGLTVIPPSEVDPIFKDVASWRDGFYDPKTGKLDPARVRGAFEEALERLDEKFGRVDAFAFASVRVVNARLESDWAGWSGTTEYAGASASKRVFFLNRHSGYLRALSFVVELVGRDGNALYADAGGIQLLEKVDTWGKRVPVLKADLLASDERNAAAVYLATDALVDGLRHAPAPVGAPDTPAPGGPGPAPAAPAPPPDAPEVPRAPPPGPSVRSGGPAAT